MSVEKVIDDFISTYGIGRVTQAKAVMGYFKDYGLSDNALQVLGKDFNAHTIEYIQNVYMKSGIMYSGTDTELILILFKQAGGAAGTASSCSNALITLGSYGIAPTTFAEYGIMPSISGITAAATFFNKGITPSLMKRLSSYDISPSNYSKYGIVGADSADAVARALENMQFTPAYINTLESISDDFASRLSKYNMSIKEFDAVRLTRYEFLNVTAEEIIKTFDIEREEAKIKFADQPDLLAQKMRLIDDEYNMVMEQRQVLQNLTPEERLAKYENLKALRKAYKAPDKNTLMSKYCPTEDIYNFLKEVGAYKEIGGYVTKAADTRGINSYEQLVNTLRIDYPGNTYGNAPSKSFGVIFYKTDYADEITIPTEEGELWPCTNKGFISNVNGKVVPEYHSPYLQPSVAEMYLVNGITGEMILIAVYDASEGVKRLIPVSGIYWTEGWLKILIKILEGE